MNLLACIPALFILITAFDRLRQVNWKTAKTLAVLALLVQSWVGLWVLYDAFASSLAWWQWIMLLAATAWLYSTRGEWREGVPLHAQTGNGELGEPEVES